MTAWKSKKKFVRSEQPTVHRHLLEGFFEWIESVQVPCSAAVRSKDSPNSGPASALRPESSESPGTKKAKLVVSFTGTGSSELGDGVEVARTAVLSTSAKFNFVSAPACLPNHLASTVFDTHEGARLRSVC